MAARLIRLLLIVGLLVGGVLPSPVAAAVVRLPTSHETATSPVPARGADPAYARSYFGARYYRAEIGRFTTVDPVYTWQENLEDPQRWNRYAYVRNNPLRYVDSDGRQIAMASPNGLTREDAELNALVRAELEARGPIAAAFAKTLGRLLFPVTSGERTVVAGADLMGVGTALALPGAASKVAALPGALAGGASDVSIYFGVRESQRVYVGITNNISRRASQHGARFVLEPLAEAPVARGEARAIEQALKEANPGFENIRNSISPRHSYYQQAVDWGMAWLHARGIW